MISPLKPRDVQLSVKQAGMFQGIKSVGLSQPKNVSSEIEDCSDEWNQETLLKRFFNIQDSVPVDKDSRAEDSELQTSVRVKCPKDR